MITSRCDPTPTGNYARSNYGGIGRFKEGLPHIFFSLKIRILPQTSTTTTTNCSRSHRFVIASTHLRIDLSSHRVIAVVYCSPSHSSLSHCSRSYLSLSHPSLSHFSPLGCTDFLLLYSAPGCIISSCISFLSYTAAYINRSISILTGDRTISCCWQYSDSNTGVGE